MIVGRRVAQLNLSMPGQHFKWRSGGARSAGEDSLEIVGRVPTKSTSHREQ